ncbi:methionyl-tRNA formyltransferase [Algoriphagus machipongonensis]|uniref:Methionyl-tRNA formyltransferase n=1 Tax=Algoriphagus machipongonensis TaxID=388413 RepID=A3HS54_9BACT|nr:formyltransferase family protein [Algoriphagus machipongonensis]EAZ82672.1 putative methionyl-tRNA formyltransferase [Algoriphagus machipongonensis]
MKIIFFTQSNWSIPAIIELGKTHEISGVVTQLQGPNFNPQLIGFLEQSNLPIIDWDQISKDGWASISKDSDIGISFGFSKKIKEEIFSSFPMGVLNVHFGKLPKYAGPAPLFWTLKNQEPTLTISFHLIDQDWDAGDLVYEEDIPIFPGEPFGLLGARAAQISGGKLNTLLGRMDSIQRTPLKVNSHQLKRPTELDLTIDWKELKANEIEALVNASNPGYGGAITTFRGSQLKILEVSPAEVNEVGIFSPGTIVYSDPNYGVFVICGDYNCLRLNILQLEGTIITGQKIAALGVRVNEKFGS